MTTVPREARAQIGQTSDYFATNTNSISYETVYYPSSTDTNSITSSTSSTNTNSIVTNSLSGSSTSSLGSSGSSVGSLAPASLGSFGTLSFGGGGGGLPVDGGGGTFTSQALVNVTYTMLLANFNAQRNERANNPPYAGSYSNSPTEIGQFANGGSFGNTPGAAAFQTFTTTGNGNTGSVRALQAGDTFTITGYVASNPSAGGRIGISFRDSTTYTDFFSSTDAATEARFQLDNTGNWKVYGSSTVETSFGANADRTFVIKITSDTTFDAQVGGTWYYNNTMAASGGSIDSFAIYTFGDSNPNSFWKNGALSNTGTVELGYALGGSSTYTPGVVANGLDANSTTAVTTNAVFVGGNSNSLVVLNQANTYGGATTVNALATARAANNNAFGTNGTVTVTATGRLQMSNGITVSRLLVLNGDGLGGSGALQNVSGDNTWSGGISNNSSARINSDAGLLTLSGNITNATSQTLFIGGSGNTTLAGTLTGALTSGNGALFKDGAGTLTLSANNSGLSGLVRLRAGTLAITNANSLGTGSLELGNAANTATLLVNSNATITNRLEIADSSTAGVINIATNTTTTVSGILSQTNGTANTTKFGKDGAGTLIFNNAGSTYNGQFQVGNGTLILGTTGAMGTNTSTTARGIDLGLNVGDTSTTNNVFLLASNGVTVGQSIYVAVASGSAVRTIGLSGNGTNTFSNEIFLDGGLTVNSGSSATDVVNLTGAIAGGGGHVMNITGSGTVASTSTSGSSSARWVVNSGSTLAIGNLRNLGELAGGYYANKITLSGGTLRGTNSTSLTNVGIQLSANSTISVDSGVTLTNPAAMGGSGVLTKSGTGVLVLAPTNSNTNTGGVTLSAGTLRVGTNNALGTGTFVINGGIFASDGGTAWTNTNSVTMSNNVQFGDATGTGALTLSNINLNAAVRTLTVSNSTTIAGVMSNGASAAGLTKEGGGTLTLSGANTYTGATTINAGTLALGANNALSDSTAVSLTAGTLNFGGFSDTVNSFTISGGAFTNGTLTATNGYSLAGGTVGGTLGSGAATNTGTTSLTGTLNTTSLAVNSGTITLGSANRMSDSLAATVGGGTLNLGGFTDTVGSFTISSGAFTNGTLTSTGGYALQGGTVAGVLGAGAITVSSGTTALQSAGRLNAASSVAINSGQLTVAGNESVAALSGSGGTLSVSSGTFTTTFDSASNNFAGTITGAGGLAKAGSGTLSLSGDASGIGTISVSAGRLQIGNGSTTGTIGNDNVSLSSGANLAFNRSDNITYNGVISGAGGTLTKLGGGVLTISNTQTYTGATTVSGGTLSYVGTNTNTATTVASGGTLIGSGSLGNVTVQSGGTINPGLSPGTLSVSNLVWEAGGNYNWQVHNAVGTAGATNGYDTIVGQSLNITATEGNKFNINLWSLSGVGPDTNGAAINFTNTSGYTWTLGTFTNGITNFAANLFSINTIATNNTAGFANTFSGAFSIYTTNSTNLVLAYTAADDTYNVTVASGSTNQNLATGGTNQFVGLAALNKLGAGTLVMTNTNTYQGVTTIVEGTISIVTNAPSGANGALGNAITEVNVGTATNAVAAGFDIGAANVTNSRNLNIVAGSGSAARTIGTTNSTGTAEQAGGVAFNTNATLYAVSGGTMLYSGVLSGSGNLTISNSGTSVFSGANTYSGTTTVLNGSTLRIANSTALGTTAGNTVIDSGGTLALSNNITEDEAITLSGAGVGSAGAIRNISGNNTLSGNLTLGAASRINADSGTLLTVSGGINGANFGLTVGGAGNTTISGAITNSSSSLTKDGAGTLILSGANNYSGGTLVSAGTLQGNTTSLQGTMTNNAAVVFDQATAGTYSGAMSGTGSLTKTNAGTLTLSGSSSYGGGTVINQGGIIIGNNSALGTGTITNFAAGGSLSTDGTARTIANNLALSNDTVIGGSGALAINGTTTIFVGLGLTNNNSGGLTLSNVALGNTAVNRTLTLAGTGNTTINGVIANSASPNTGSFTINSSGTTTLNGANTFTGTLTLSAGTLVIGNNAALGAGAAVFNDGVTVNSDSTARNVANNISFENLQIGGTGALTLAGTLTHTRAGPSTLTNNNAAGLSLGNINLSSSATVSRTLTFAGTGNTTVTGVIADGTNAAVTNSQIVLNASGTTLTLSGANTYRGLSTITAGTLLAANSAALGATNNGTTVASGATLAFSNNINSAEAITISGTGVSSNGVIRNIAGNNTNTGTVTLDAANNRIQVDTGTSLTLGAIANGTLTNNLTLSANGTLRVTGAFTGAGINAVLQKDGAGSLVISNSGTTGLGQLQIGGGTVTVEQGSFSASTSTSTRAIDLGISSTGDSTNNTAFYASSGLTISNSIFVAANTTNNALRILGTESTSGTVTYNNQIYLGTDSTLQVASAGTANVVLSGNITNDIATAGASATLTKVGLGTLTLSASNDWRGNFIIGEGTAILNSANSIRDSASVTISNNANLNLNVTEEVGSITGLGNISLGANQLRAGGNNNSTTFSGVMSSSSSGASFVKQGTGTTTLSGSNTMNGQTFIDAGTLRFDVTQGGTFTNRINIGAESGTAAATLAVGASGVALTNPISVRSGSSGTLTIAALNTNGTATIGGTTTLSNAVTVAVNSGGNLSLGPLVMNNSNFTYTGSNNLTMAGAISASSGAADFRVSGTGTVTLAADNSVGNEMKIILNSGTLSVGALSALGTTPGTFYQDKINFNGGTLSVTGNITIAAGTMGMTSSGSGGTIDVAANTTFTQNAFVTGNAAGTFNKTGQGTLVLGDAGNGFNPTFNIQAGTVQVGSIGALGTNVTAIGLGTASTSGTLRYTGSSASFNDNIAVGAAGGTIDVTVASLGTTLTNTGIISGGALTKAGDSILVLSGNNIYTNTVISGGMLTVTADTNLGTAPGAAANNISIGNGRLGLNGNFTVNANRGILLTDANSTIDVYGGNSATVAGIITNTGSGALTKLGTGTLTLTGANTYTGNTAVGAGVLRATAANSLGAANNSVTVSDGATLQLTNATGFDLARNITLSGNGTVSGALLSIGGANTNSGGMTLAANSIVGVSAGSLVLSGNITNGGNRLTLDTYGVAGTPLTVSGVITGNGGLSKIGTGTAVLSGANDYAGGTEISIGTLQVGDGGATGQLGGGNVTNNSALSFNRTGTLSVTNTISGTGTMAKAGAGTVTLTGANTFSGGVTVDGGTLALNRTGGAALGGSNAITINTNGTLRTDAAGQIVGAPLVTVNSGGTYDLNGNNQTNALRGAGSVTLGTGTLNISNIGPDTFSGVISGSGGVTKTGAGVQTLSGSNTYTGATTMTVGELALGADNVIGDASAVTINGGTFNLGARAETLNSITMSDGALQRGGGTLTLTNASSFTGGTVTLSSADSRINTAGTTTLGSVGFNYSSASANNNALVLGGDLSVNASTTANITNAGGGAVRLNLNDAVRTFDVGSAGHLNLDWVVWSSANSAGGITKTGAGTVTLGQANLFTGGFTLSNGVVRAGNNASLGGSGGVVNLNGGTIASTDANARSFANALNIGGDVTFGQTSGGTGAITFSSTATNNLGGAARTLTTDVATTINGALGNGSITKAGAATLSLSNTGTSLANLNITAGTVAFQTNATVGGLAGSGSGALSLAGGTLTVNASTNSSFGQVISGAGGLTKSGTGTVTLTGNNNFSGATTISAGTLAVNGTNSTSAVTIGSTGTLAGTGRVGATTVQSGGFISPGNSIGTLAVDALTLAGGGGYIWEVADVTGSAGTDYDLISVGGGTGAATVTATSGNPYVIHLTSYTGFTNWNSGGTFSWNIIDWGTVSGFDASAFTVNTNNFSGAISGAFTFANTNGFLVMTYTAGTPVYNDGAGTWSGGFNPALANGNNAEFTGAGGNATNNISTNTVSSIGNLTFSNTAGAYTLSASNGSAGFDAASRLAVNGNIVNNSTNAQTINMALGFDAARTIDAAAGNMTFGSTISNGVGLTFTGVSNNTVSGAISGAGTVAKTGSGTLFLNGANTYTGATTISNGVVQLGNATGLGATNGGTTVISGATLDLNGQTVAGEALSLAGTGVGGNGALINSSASASSLSGAVTLTGDSTVGTTGNMTLSGAVGGAFSLTKVGAATLTLSASNAYSGGTVVNGGTIAIGNNNALGTGAVTLGNGTTIGATGSARTNANNLVAAGDFTFGFTGGAQSTFSGNLDLGGATRAITLGFNSTNAATIGGVVSNGGINLLSTLANATLNLTGASTFSGPLNINGGTLAMLGGGTLNTAVAVDISRTNGNSRFDISGITADTFTIGSLAAADSATATVNLGGKTLIAGGNNSNTTFGGVISNTGSFVKTGTGTTTITRASTYTGATTISNGEIALTGAGDLSSMTALNLAGATARFDISGKTSGETNGSLAGVAGSVVNLGTNNLTVGGDNTSTTFAGSITNTGSLTKTGTGTMTLSGANTFSGGSTLSGGALRVAHANALGTGAMVSSAGTTLEVTNSINVTNTLSVFNVNFLNGGNTLSGRITNNNTVYTANTGQTNTLSGYLTGTGSVTLIGGGVLDITGTTNDYTGNTVISNGTIRISTLTNTSTPGSLGVSNNITLAGTTTSTNLNANTTAAIDYSGGNVTTDRTFVIDNGGGTINMATAATEMTLTGSASGSGKLIVGEGTLILNGGSNAFAPGSIQVDSGATLQLAANNQISDSTGLILNGGTFRVGTASTGFSDTLGTLTLSASSTIDLGAWSTGLRTLTFANSSAISWTGTLTITNWQGVALQSSDVAEIIFGTGGLTSTQLGQIYFANQNINGGALIGGELVPVPEPRVYAAAIALLAAVGWRERKRLRVLIAKGLRLRS